MIPARYPFPQSQYSDGRATPQRPINNANHFEVYTPPSHGMGRGGGGRGTFGGGYSAMGRGRGPGFRSPADDWSPSTPCPQSRTTSGVALGYSPYVDDVVINPRYQWATRGNDMVDLRLGAAMRRAAPKMGIDDPNMPRSVRMEGGPAFGVAQPLANLQQTEPTFYFSDRSAA